MDLISFLWCVFALVVVVMAWVTLKLNLAVKKEMAAREALAVQLAALHDIDMASLTAKALKRRQ